MDREATPYNLRSRKREYQYDQTKKPSSQIKKRKSSKIQQPITGEDFSTEQSLMCEKLEREVISLDTVQEEVEDRVRTCLNWEEEEEEEAEEDSVVKNAGNEAAPDSDGPDDIPLSTAKKMAIDELHQQNKSRESYRISRKERRKQRQEMYKQQKELRQQQQMQKLSADELKEVVAALGKSEQDQSKAEGTLRRNSVGKHKRLKMKHRTSLYPEEGRSFSGVQVIAMDTQLSREPCAASFHTAHEFLKSRLYDGHNRVPALSLRAKTYRFQPAKNFHKTCSL